MTHAKVLLCHNHYAQQGGEGAVFENLERGLRERGHPVVTYVRQSVEIQSMSVGSKAKLLASALHSDRTRQELTRLVASERPDVAVVQNVFPLLSPAVYTTLRRLGVPIIQAIYNYRLVSPAGELYSRGQICERSLQGNYAHCVFRRCYRNSAGLSAWYASILGWHRWRGTFAETIDVFQVPDDFMAGKLTEGGLPPSKMAKNVNPFFVRDYQATTSHEGYIAYVGRLVRHKGIMTLVEAARTSARIKLVVAGSGELDAELREWARSEKLGDRIEFRGPLWGADLERLMSGACAIAVPSEWYDNLPLILCQANALGKPVLASRINGIPEYVQPDINGFLFTPGNSAELAGLAESVLSLNQSDYAALATRARRFAEERLDFEQYYRVFATLVDRLAEVKASSQ